jgi:uncharacterized protein
MDLLELRRRIGSDVNLGKVLEIAKAQESADPGHDLSHALRVALWTVRLGEECDPREAIAAALLHDVVDVPKNSPERSAASALSARMAARALPAAGFDAAAIQRICEAIEDHSFSRGAVPRSALGRALQDADRLDALGALGVLRTASCGAAMGARFLDAGDPWARRRGLDDQRYTVDHFFVKLLRLEAAMNTETGRAEARRRTEFMRAFLRQLGQEIGESMPDSSDLARVDGV